MAGVLAPAAMVVAGLVVVTAPSPSAQAAAHAVAPVLRAGTLTAMLHARGTVSVEWNGVSIPVTDASYAYLGGEVVRTGPDGIAALRLDGGGLVVLCTSTTARIDRATAGHVVLTVERGSVRVTVPGESGVEILAGGIGLRSHATTAAGSVDAEVSARPRGGCLVCTFAGATEVSWPQSGRESPTATLAEGRIVLIEPTPPDDPAASLGGQSLPGAATAVAIPAAAAATPRSLCACETLQRPADARAAEAATVSAAVTTPAARPATAATAPALAPPGPPGLAVAEPAPPGGFDPSALPPPAAGPPGAGTPASAPPLVVLPPPLVPIVNTGGGEPASAS
ncbi:MAG: hypothetical protein H6983_13725 [Ectothiorhodospiraceae bacterium]|nr:hypothetical protein [Ectothiorhodospiraceae bacterium]